MRDLAVAHAVDVEVALVQLDAAAATACGRVRGHGDRLAAFVRPPQLEMRAAVKGAVPVAEEATDRLLSLVDAAVDPGLRHYEIHVVGVHRHDHVEVTPIRRVEEALKQLRVRHRDQTNPPLVPLRGLPRVGVGVDVRIL